MFHKVNFKMYLPFISGADTTKNLYEIRLDNCKYETIKKVIESKYFPTNEIVELPIFNTIEFK